MISTLKNIPHFNKTEHNLSTKSSKSHKRIAVLNLMPMKKQTEQDFIKLFSYFNIDIKLTFLSLKSYKPKNTPAEYLRDFYKFWEEELNNLDGLILTGAPIETLNFYDVIYWEELTKLLEKIKKILLPSIFICWSAQAALFYYYKIKKTLKGKKLFGFFPLNFCEELKAFSSSYIPVSRYAESEQEAIKKSPSLKVLAETNETGISIIKDNAYPFLYIFDHLEYPKKRLKEEFIRDKKLNKIVSPPQNYPLKNNEGAWENLRFEIYQQFFSLY